MIATTYNGTAVFLLNIPPDWSNGFTAKLSIPSKIDTSKANLEERESTGLTLRTVFNYSTLANAQETALVRGLMDAYDNRPVLCPFWPSVSLIGGTAALTGALKVWFEPDWSKWSIGTTGPTGFVPSAACLVAPLVWGRFQDEELPKGSPVNGLGDTVWDFSFVERGVPSLALTPFTIALATETVNGNVFPVLTIPASWGSNTSKGNIKVTRKRVGFGRGEKDTFVSQFPRREHRMNFRAMDQAEIRYLFTLFAECRGNVGAFKGPVPWSTTERELCRFDSDELTVTWVKPALAEETAQASITMRTVPSEAVTLSGETVGVTLGAKPTRWHGYIVTQGGSTWRFTSHESPIVGPGGTFESRGINHGKIDEELNLQIHDVTLDVAAWEGSPFHRLRGNPHYEPMQVQILEGWISNPTAAQVIFTGNAMPPKPGDDGVWKVKLKGLGSVLSVDGPRLMLQPECCAVLGDSRCQYALSGQGRTVEAVISPDTIRFGGSSDANSFAMGYAEFTVEGGTRRASIISSYDASGGHVCVFDSPIIPAPAVGSVWSLFIGCDGSKARCKALGNFINFQGAPEMPDANPAMIPVKSSTGGKK